jgi:hypothetical protein
MFGKLDCGCVVIPSVDKKYLIRLRRCDEVHKGNKYDLFAEYIEKRDAKLSPLTVDEEELFMQFFSDFMRLTKSKAERFDTIRDALGIRQ